MKKKKKKGGGALKISEYFFSILQFQKISITHHKGGL